MKKWVRRIRGAVGMGVTWAVGWALTGLLIGVMSILLPGLPWWDATFRIFDAPLPALAIPGFFAGALFSLVLGMAGHGRRFSDLSLPGVTAWGAVGGLLLSLVPAAMDFVGLATINPEIGLWRLTAAVSGPLSVLSAVSACVTLLVARRGEDRALLEAGDDPASVGLTSGEARELLGAGTELSPGIHPRAKERALRPDRSSGPGGF